MWRLFPYSWFLREMRCESGNANNLAFRIYIVVVETRSLFRCVRVPSERLKSIKKKSARSRWPKCFNWYDYWHFHRSQIWNVFSQNSWRQYDIRYPIADVYGQSRYFSTMNRWYRKQKVLKNLVFLARWIKSGSDISRDDREKPR